MRLKDKIASIEINTDESRMSVGIKGFPNNRIVHAFKTISDDGIESVKFTTEVWGAEASKGELIELIKPFDKKFDDDYQVFVSNMLECLLVNGAY